MRISTEGLATAVSAPSMSDAMKLSCNFKGGQRKVEIWVESEAKEVQAESGESMRNTGVKRSV